MVSFSNILSVAQLHEPLIYEPKSWSVLTQSIDEERIDAGKSALSRCARYKTHEAKIGHSGFSVNIHELVVA
jgi:hypothetical protein